MSEYESPAHNVPAKKKGKGCLIAALIVGLLGMLMLGGCLGLMYFGVGKMNEQVTAQLQSEPWVTDYVGTVKEVKMDMMATGEANQGAAAGTGDIIVCDVTGSKRSARVKIQQKDNRGGFRFAGSKPSWLLEMTTPTGELAVFDGAPAALTGDAPPPEMYTVLIVADSSPSKFQLNGTRPIDLRSLEIILSRITPHETVSIEVPEGMEKAAQEEVGPLIKKYRLNNSRYQRPKN